MGHPFNYRDHRVPFESFSSFLCRSERIVHNLDTIDREMEKLNLNGSARCPNIFRLPSSSPPRLNNHFEFRISSS